MNRESSPHHKKGLGAVAVKCKVPRELLPSLLDKLSVSPPSSAEIFGQTGCGY